MSNTVVGNVYDRIIKEVVDTSRLDFEESGIDDAVLEELRSGWQRKLTQLRVAEFPWDPKLDASAGAAAAAAAAAAPAPPSNVPPYAQQQMSPQDGAMPLPSPSNGQQQPGLIKPDPDVKQEPGLADPLSAPAYPTDPRSVAAARATQALQKNYGNRATSSINAIQAGMTVQNPAHAAAMQQHPLNGHPNPEQAYQQQVPQAAPAQHQHQQHPQYQHPQHQQHPQQQQYQQQQQPQHPQQHQQSQYQPQMPQTDGADGADALEAEGVLMQRDADGNVVEMGRLDIDRMLHARILENAKSMEGGGFMVPLKEATRHTAPRKNRKARRAPGQVDGEDDEDDEDAINSDLDDTDDDREDSEVDEEGLSHIMLCMYDKVQRVKNKWKCTLKDGVLTVNGKEYVFHKATGEYEW